MKMIRNILLFSLICINLNFVNAQNANGIQGTVVKKIVTVSSEQIPEGANIELLDYYSDDAVSGYWIKYNNKDTRIYEINLKKIKLLMPDNKEDLWKYIRLKSDYYSKKSATPLNNELRRDLEDETYSLINNLGTNYGFFEDEYVEDYIQSLLYKIHAITIGEERPGNLSVKVVKINTPNAFSCSNGTIIITTGLLSIIRNEDQLIAALAHEIAHFDLDHQVNNILKQNARQKKAEFWAGVATAAAAATEIYMASKNEYYIPGQLTMDMAYLSSNIAYEITDRLGQKYSQEQEIEADNAAKTCLKYLKCDTTALASILNKIYDYSVSVGDFYAISASGTHPAIFERIRILGGAKDEITTSKQYDKIISLAITQNAISEYQQMHLEASLNLVNRNINSGCPIEDDLILKSILLRKLYNNQESNLEALQLLSQAKTLNVLPNNYLYKQEGITLLRLNRNKEAVESFKTYLASLEKTNNKVAADVNKEEIEWVKKMISKTATP